MRRLRGICQRCSTAAIAVLLLLSPAAAWGMNCPFCYSKAMSSSTGMLQAFRSGIIILMIPPFLMSIGIALLVYKRRNSFRSV
jgi:hypothetical protein